MMRCSYCGYDTYAVVERCSQCGQKMEVTHRLTSGDTTSPKEDRVIRLQPSFELAVCIGKHQVIMPFPAQAKLILGRVAYSVVANTVILPQITGYTTRTNAERSLVLDDFLPFLSLTAFQVDTTSVSREHLAVHYECRALIIEDLNSTNGTFMNGTRLEPGHQYLLHNGDYLRLGALPIKLQFHTQSYANLQRRTG